MMKNLFGPHGSGKTAWAKDLLNQLGMDSIWYTSSDQRNKAFFENLYKNNISNHDCYISLFQIKMKIPIVIVMDDIDSMIVNDKLD